MTEGYRVQLDVFSGPLDLLLFLIRRDELDIHDVPVARVTDQYLEYVRVLEALDPNAAGDFLVMATTLVELKSRALLPTPPLEPADDDDPRSLLVKQLLEYKRFKDAAKSLGRASDDRAKRYVRKPAELPAELRGVELEEAQIWDLLAAFGRVMSSIGKGPGLHEVRYDDTPIEMYQEEVFAALSREGTSTFQVLFEGRTRKVEIIGLFLAILELIRKKLIRAEQTGFGDIYLFMLEEVIDEEAGAEDVAEPEFEGVARGTNGTDTSPDTAWGEDDDDPLDADRDAEPGRDETPGAAERQRADNTDSPATTSPEADPDSQEDERGPAE